MIIKDQYLISSAGFRPGMSIIFSKKNKNDFIRAAYIYAADYFNDSLRKLHLEFPQIETAFCSLDESHFMASVYLNGTAVVSCRIWFGGNNRITFLTECSVPEGSHCDFLAAEEEKGRLFLKSLPDIEKENKLTIKLSAEYLWKKFTFPLKNISN